MYLTLHRNKNCIRLHFLGQWVTLICTFLIFYHWLWYLIPIIPFINQKTNTTSFIIDGKSCVYYRNKEWAHQYYQTEDTERILSRVQKELKIPYHVLLFFRTSDSLEDVKSRLSELEDQKIKPKILTIIDRSHTESVMTGELMKICQNYKFDHWRIQAIQAIDQIDNDIIDLA